ncbi:MAG: TrbG/VirB9 family P-type conjugative transfer protein [Terriglobia bacterium]
MKKFITLSFLLCAAGPSILRAADGARLVRYSQKDVIPINAKVRFSTLIVLPANEEILDYTTGDKDYWIINGVHNLCYLHPAAEGIKTDLNLVTASGHIYSFLLTEISKEPGAQPDLKVFVVPKGGSSLAKADDPPGGDPPKYVRASEVEAYRDEITQLRNQVQQEIHAADARAASEIEQYRASYPQKLRFDYRYDRKAAKAPFEVSAIYHDGKFTYIQCHAQEKPTIYEIKDGKPDLVNFDFENGVYIVPEVVNEGYIAVGKKKIEFSRRQQG